MDGAVATSCSLAKNQFVSMCKTSLFLLFHLSELVPAYDSSTFVLVNFR